jgi:hypothetical protein
MTKRDTTAVFDWLMSALSYQGIADQIAYDYMEQHGYVRWHDINGKLARGASCPKLKSYWHFYGCGYQKLRRTCTEPDHNGRCPVPTHDLRNGHLNQTAYSLYLFIRDIADGDLIGWIDQRLQAASSPAGPDRLARMRAAVIAPLREIYGVSDKWPCPQSCSERRTSCGRGRRSAPAWSPSTPSFTTFCTGPASCTGSAPTMPMARLATGAAAALTLFKPWPNGSTPAPSIPRSRRCFPGSCSTRSGGTAPGAASMFATATALMIERLARMSTVEFIVFAIELRFIINRLSA